MASGSDSTLLVTLIHDDTDAVKLCIKDIRSNLIHVDPLVNFESCCLWEFQDETFYKLNTVLVILSKNSEAFVRRLYITLLKRQRLFLANGTRVCVISETDNPRIGDGLESLIGEENISLVHDLLDTFAWIPKLCAFLYKPNKPRRYLHKCVIPRVIEDANLELTRKHLITTLRKRQVNVSEDIKRIVPFRCAFMMRRRQKEPIDNLLRKNVLAAEKRGSVILDYVMHYEGKVGSTKRRRRVTYGKYNQILFVIHLLYVIGLTDINSIKDRSLRRRISRKTAIWENIASVDIVGYCLLSVLNPGLVFYPFTPLPYLAVCLYRVTGKKLVWNVCFTFWMIIFLMALYGIIFYFLARQRFFIYAAPGFGIVLICALVCTFVLVRLVTQTFETLTDLSLI